MFSLGQIIGMKVMAIKGFITTKRVPKKVHPAYILFGDRKTIVQLDEQDYHNYHDCSIYARHICVVVCSALWKDIMENTNGYYPDATEDIC